MRAKIAVNCQLDKPHSATAKRYALLMERGQSSLDVFLENVARVMERRGISKIELGRMAAKRGAYAPRTITSALNREFRSPAFSVCAAIAEALGTPIHLLLIPGIRLESLESLVMHDLVSDLARIRPETLAFIKSVIERDLKD